MLKKEGKLDERERGLIKQHTTIGYEISQAGPQVSEIVLDVRLHHHELLDGSGYPEDGRMVVGEGVGLALRSSAPI